jgi:hypothetical protein
MSRNRTLLLAAMLAGSVHPIWAQQDATAGAAQPQWATMTIGSGASKRTISQLTMPLIVVIPVTSSFNFDIATAVARSEVTEPGVATSSIQGPTDMQVRANYTFGNDRFVATFGANLPTGQYKIADAEIKAAGQIGSDFLMFTTSSYGAGMSATGGLAAAWSLGTWNLGLAGSFRKSSRFNAFKTTDQSITQVLTFQPADEVRLRVGVDRYIGAGRFALGATFSKFGNDELANTSYATGDRVLGQGSYVVPVGSTDLIVSTWGLFRQKGQQYGGPAPAENLYSGSVALGFHLGNNYLEPSVEARNWQIAGTKAGLLANVGVRGRLTTGGLFSFSPSVSGQFGKLYSTLDGSSVDLTGIRIGMTVRAR